MKTFTGCCWGKAAVSKANKNSQGVTDVGQQWSKGWAQRRTWNQRGLRPRSSNQAPQAGSFLRLQSSPSPSPFPKLEYWGVPHNPSHHPVPPCWHNSPELTTAQHPPKRCRAEAKPLMAAHAECYIWGTFQPTPRTCPSCLGQIIISGHTTISFVYTH